MVIIMKEATPTFFSSTNSSSHGCSNTSLRHSFPINRYIDGSWSTVTASTQDSSCASKGVDICCALISKQPPTLPLREELCSIGFETVRSRRGTALRCVINDSIQKLESSSNSMKIKHEAQNAVTYAAYNKSYESYRCKKRSERKMKFAELHRHRLELDRTGFVISPLDPTDKLIPTREKDDINSKTPVSFSSQEFDKKKLVCSLNESEFLLDCVSQSNDLNSPFGGMQKCLHKMTSEQIPKCRQLLNVKPTNGVSSATYTSESVSLKKREIQGLDENYFSKNATISAELDVTRTEEDNTSNSFSMAFYSTLDTWETVNSTSEPSIVIPKDSCENEAIIYGIDSASCMGSSIETEHHYDDSMMQVRIIFSHSNAEVDIEDIEESSNSFSIDQYVDECKSEEEDDYAYSTDDRSCTIKSASHVQDDGDEHASFNTSYYESTCSSAGIELDLQQYYLKAEKNAATRLEFGLRHVSLKESDLDLDSYTNLLDRDYIMQEGKKSAREKLHSCCCRYNYKDDTGNSNSSLVEQTIGWTSRLLDNVASYCGLKTYKSTDEFSEYSEVVYDVLDNEESFHNTYIPYREQNKMDASSDISFSSFESQDNVSCNSYMVSVGESMFGCIDEGNMIVKEDDCCHDSTEVNCPRISSPNQGKGIIDSISL